MKQVYKKHFPGSAFAKAMELLVSLNIMIKNNKKIIFLIICAFLLIGAKNETIESRLSFFELGSIEEVKTYLVSLQQIASMSYELLLKEFQYPFSLHENGKIIKTYTTEVEARKDIDVILTSSVLMALKSQKVDDLFINYQGIMIGDGEIWLNYAKEGGYYIKAINP